MVDFVRKGMLGTLDRFKNYFETPIINGMLRDSSPYDVKVRARGCGPAGDRAVWWGVVWRLCRPELGCKGLQTHCPCLFLAAGAP